MVSMGELLIDFVSTTAGCHLRHASTFEKAPGGAQADVAVGLARPCVKSGFIGQIGADKFGECLREVLVENRVGVVCLRTTQRGKTGLPFVSLTESGERNFLFYREPCPDMLLEPDDTYESYIAGAGVFHHDSITFTCKGSSEECYFSGHQSSQETRCAGLV